MDLNTPPQIKPNQNIRPHCIQQANRTNNKEKHHSISSPSSHLDVGLDPLNGRLQPLGLHQLQRLAGPALQLVHGDLREEGKIIEKMEESGQGKWGQLWRSTSLSPLILRGSGARCNNAEDESDIR